MKFIREILMREFRIYCSIILVAVFGSCFFSNIGFAQKQLKWVDITLIDIPGSVTAGGESNFQGKQYPVSNLFDGDEKTCWVSRFERNKENPSVLIKLSDPKKTTVKIFPGYGKNKALFIKNSRPRAIQLSVFAAINPAGHSTELATSYKAVEFPVQKCVHLADAFRLQSVDLTFSQKELSDFIKMVAQQYDSLFELPKAESCLILKIEVTEVWQGTKSNDICISEIFLGDASISSKAVAVSPEVKKVYLNADENALLKDDNDHIGTVVYADPHSVLQVLEVSENNKWAILISMPAETQGRVETLYLLVDLLNNRIVNSKIGKIAKDYISGSPMYFDAGPNGLLYLIYSATNGEFRKIELK
jgi:hypothetical protein